MSQKNYWGPETEKALANFGRSQPLPRSFIRAFAEVKKAALLAIYEIDGAGSSSVSRLSAHGSCSSPVWQREVIRAVERIIAGELDDNFILPLKQGGAGTSLNMNFNEVIAALAGESLAALARENGGALECADPGVTRGAEEAAPAGVADLKPAETDSSGAAGGLHLPDPLEDINRYQSTNDVLPTALTIYVYRQLEEVEGFVIRLQEMLISRENEYAGLLMTGRTELQAALPITLGQVFSGWAGCIERDRWRLHKLKERVRSIALGGTALGTCCFAPRRYVFRAEGHLREITGLPLSRSQNLVDEISNQDKLAELASGFNLLAQNLVKISSDLLLYTSSLAGELSHPELQYGSSFMPAKTNPVMLELVKGLALDVQGECSKIFLYSQNGQLQLNAFLPFMVDAFRVIHSSLKRALIALMEGFLVQMKVREERISANLLASHTYLNLLLPYVGYHKLKALYRTAGQAQITDLEDLKELVMRETGISPEQLAECFHPRRATTYFRKGDEL